MINKVVDNSLGMVQSKKVSRDATAQAIDKEVRDLVDDAHETALNILRSNLPLLESISQKILQEEVIEGEDLKNLLAESKMPA